MLNISKLNAGYNDLQVLKDVDLSLTAGTISILMGPNGAGKSTLLKSIYNLTKITSGKIEFKQKEITHEPPYNLLKQGVAFVPQGKINFSILNVRDNLILGHIGNDKSLLKNKLEEIFNQFPVLKKKQNDYAFALSGGEQQMLAIGRALMSSPKLLLMDEPSLGLSPKLVKELFSTIQEIKNKFKTTILIVEHNIKSVMEIADFCYIMDQGKIIASGPADKLKNDPIMKKVFVGTLE